jgi:hypothetical protein
MITALENHLWQSTLFCGVVALLTPWAPFGSRRSRLSWERTLYPQTLPTRRNGYFGL